MFKVFLFVLLFATQSFAAENILTWLDNSNNETGFKVYSRAGLAGTFTELATLGPNITTYTHTFPDGEIHCYQVRVFNDAGENLTPTNIDCGPKATAPSKLTIQGTTIIIVTP